MRKSLLSWLVVVLVGLALSGTVGAAPVPKTIEVGENVACDYSTIAAAIAAAYAGDTIKVQNKIFYEPSLVVNKKLTFIGGYGKAMYGDEACLTLTGTGRATVRPGASGPLFHVQGATVSVDWFVFENGASEGVVVDSGGTLTLTNSIVQNNGDGGLVVDGATANLLETEILGNDRDYGGGIFMDGGATVTARASLIKANEGWEQGAGVYLRDASVFQAVEGTRIELNVTPWGCEDGGGVAAIGTGTTVTIDASEVLSNTALTRGGGIYLAGGAQAWVQNGSWMRGNQAYGPGSGGGGAAHVTGTGSSLHLKNAILYNNWSDPDGGGIHTNLGGSVEMRNSVLYGNEGHFSGGAVYNNGGSVTCRNSYFFYNRVFDYDGGGISSIGQAGTTLDVEQCFFVGNTTDSGNGGAVYAKQPLSSVRRSYFTQNTAPLNGSALFLSGMDVIGSPYAEVVNSYIVDNPPPVTPLAGGASPAGVPAYGSSLYTEHNTAYVLHNTFAHQSLAYQYGVLANADASVRLVNNIITNFSIGISREAGGTELVDAAHTLYWGNLADYNPVEVSSSDEVHGDPAFAGPSNYNLTATSAAINTGTDAGVTLDYYGGHRPWGGGFEIGAEEYPRQRRVFLPLVAKEGDTTGIAPVAVSERVWR